MFTFSSIKMPANSSWHALQIKPSSKHNRISIICAALSRKNKKTVQSKSEHNFNQCSMWGQRKSYSQEIALEQFDHGGESVDRVIDALRDGGLQRLRVLVEEREHVVEPVDLHVHVGQHLRVLIADQHREVVRQLQPRPLARVQTLRRRQRCFIRHLQRQTQMENTAIHFLSAQCSHIYHYQSSAG